jgi:hypothetical protein
MYLFAAGFDRVHRSHYSNRVCMISCCFIVDIFDWFDPLRDQPVNPKIVC